MAVLLMAMRGAHEITIVVASLLVLGRDVSSNTVQSGDSHAADVTGRAIAVHLGEQAKSLAVRDPSRACHQSIPKETRGLLPLTPTTPSTQPDGWHPGSCEPFCHSAWQWPCIASSAQRSSRSDAALCTVRGHTHAAACFLPAKESLRSCPCPVAARSTAHERRRPCRRWLFARGYP